MSKNTQISAEDVEAALDMLLEILNHQEEEPQTWEEHEEAVEAADTDEPEDNRIDLGTTPLADKLGMILHDVSNDILRGAIKLETGEETLALTQAVVLREQLRAQLKDQ